jgi:hypothetical protein
MMFSRNFGKARLRQARITLLTRNCIQNEKQNLLYPSHEKLPLHILLSGPYHCTPGSCRVWDASRDWAYTKISRTYPTVFSRRVTIPVQICELLRARRSPFEQKARVNNGQYRKTSSRIRPFNFECTRSPLSGFLTKFDRLNVCFRFVNF